MGFIGFVKILLNILSGFLANVSHGIPRHVENAHTLTLATVWDV